MNNQQGRYLDEAGLAYFYARLQDIFIQREGGPAIDYNTLSNLPTINGVVVKGNMTSEDLLLSLSSIDTTAGWQNRRDYIPKRGEIVVYSDHAILDGVAVPGIKVGDGKAYVADLPFAGDEIRNELITIINNHISDMEAHVSQADRDRWDNKLNYKIHGEDLIFNNL